MKYSKVQINITYENRKIFRKKQRNRPKLGEFIAYKYLSDYFVNYVYDKSPKELDQNKQIITIPGCHQIQIYYKNKHLNFYDDDDILKCHNVLNSLKEICTDIKNERGATFRFSDNDICLSLIVSKKKADEIMTTKEYQDWFNIVNAEYLTYKEERDFKRTTKKYNL
jgi:hypothetical protein